MTGERREPLLRIQWPVGGQVDEIPQGRDCLAVWRDQFGTIHLSAWGEWWPLVDEIQAALEPVLTVRHELEE